MGDMADHIEWANPSHGEEYDDPTLNFDGTPIRELSSSRLAEIVRYGRGCTKKTLAACKTELWRREQGQDGTRAPESTDEVNRLLVESKRKGK